MKALVIVGGTGRGKSTKIKQILMQIKKRPIIYDVNNEYYKTGYNLPEMKDFITLCENSTNQLFIFEEATMFFDHKAGGDAKRISRLLVRKRHQKNYYIFVFHAMHQVPLFIHDYVQNFILFKTDEPKDLVLSKFAKNEKIRNAYLDVFDNKNPHYFKEF